jgi:CRP/FNR family transcriptional regulator, cyclic AMP receptor protein
MLYQGDWAMPVVWEPDEKVRTAPDAIALLERAGAAAIHTNYSKNEVVFRQGSRADTVFYLQRGRMKLSLVSTQGKEAVITILPARSFFGEGCLAGQSVQIATATALVDCSVLTFKKKQVIRTIRLYPDFAEFFVTYLLKRAARLEEDLVDQLFHSSEKRLARVLLLLTNLGKDEPPDQVIPNVSQETLARMIGTTRSRVNFFMNKFRRLGFIDYDNGLHVHPSLVKMLLRD